MIPISRQSSVISRQLKTLFAEITGMGLCLRLRLRQQTIDFIEALARRQTGEITIRGDLWHCDADCKQYLRSAPNKSLVNLGVVRGKSSIHVEEGDEVLPYPASCHLAQQCYSNTPSMITDALHCIANHRQSLSREDARTVMTEVLTGQCTDAQIAALLVALHMKGETVEEIVGFAEAIRAAATPLPKPEDSAVDVSGTERDALVDTCGTGGDTSGTFNISTATALVVAGANVRVAKHGNRSVTSKCGSADVMEALGVNINLSPSRLAACLKEVGFAFLFAPAVHSAMKFVQPARRELHLRTVFNLLGPLTNPAHASGQVVGVYSVDLVEKLAEALSMLGIHRALVVHGLDGLDEITITAPTRIAEVREGKIRTYEVTPEEFGFTRASIEALAGGDAAANAEIIRSILKGEKSSRRDVVVLNAAAALTAAGVADTLADALPLAARSLDSRGALHLLDHLVKFTNSRPRRKKSA
jgi:anthranilate phosphoribosyltransferase